MRRERAIIFMFLAFLLFFPASGMAKKGKGKKGVKTTGEKVLPKPAARPIAPREGKREIVVLKARGLYLLPCMLGTQRGIAPANIPSKAHPSAYAVSCVSSVDRKTRLSAKISCQKGSHFVNYSAEYVRDAEFIIRLECEPRE